MSGRIHFVGIGGIGMSAIARVLLQRGEAVSGTDRARTAMTDRLMAEGAAVTIGHEAAAVEGADLVVVSSAVPTDNPEVRRAQALGIPVIKRAELLGRLTRTRRSVLVAGTHGKTTTSAMIAFIFSRAGRDPTVLVGGELIDLDTNGVAGAGDLLVAEADEYDSSFLSMQPWTAVVTNVEADHLDHFGSFERLQRAFAEFLALVPPEGHHVVCADDAVLTSIVAASRLPVVSYGTVDSANWRAIDLRLNERGAYDFVASADGQAYATISLAVPGRHNVLNALAACTVASIAGVRGSDAAAALGAFQGARRRFEHKGRFGAADVFDDYAHHPTEIMATLRAARERFPGRRLVVLFQPHTYSRTRHLLDEFAGAFGDADIVLLTDVYAARERDEWGVTTLDLVRAMSACQRRVEYAGTLEIAEDRLRELLEPGDVLFTVGAGDVYRVADRLAGA